MIFNVLSKQRPAYITASLVLAMTLSRQGSNTYVDAQRALVNGTDGMVTLRAGDESMSILAFNV
jgi:hypothetical protein